jgi:hypothetical protein
MKIEPENVYEYNGEQWIITMVNSKYFTIESPDGKLWVTLERKSP